MAPGNLFKPLGAFVLIVALIVGVAFAVPLALGGGGGGSDGSLYSDGAPDHMQPDQVNAPSADESGEISLDADAENKRILVDTRHANQFERDELDPLVNALVRNGHTVDFTGSASGDNGGLGAVSYNATLQEYDAVLVIHPTQPFTEQEVSGLSAYADAGGRVLVLGEPSQVVTTGSGLLAQSTRVRSQVNDLTHEFGIHVGAEQLYNMDDESTDNYYKSIYAESTGDSALTDGVDTVDLDTSTYVVPLEGGDAETALAAADGTKTYSTRKNGSYGVAARNGNVAVVGDSSFVTTSEVYDVDNERFVSNLLEFLVTGDKEEGVPEVTGGSGFSGGTGGTGGTGGNGSGTGVTP